VKNAVQSGRYGATADFDGLARCDAIVICVPAPLGLHREPDNSYIHATPREIAKRLRKDHRASARGRRKGRLLRPYFPVARHTRTHGDLGLRSVPLSAESFAEFDALLIATAHDLFKDPALYARAKLIVDARNLVGPLFGGKPPVPTVKA
jgi:UDP-N-acetyl-D-mannosaminuronate dehydrogenase